jgi:hypothetical protein
MGFDIFFLGGVIGTRCFASPSRLVGKSTKSKNLDGGCDASRPPSRLVGKFPKSKNLDGGCDASRPPYESHLNIIEQIIFINNLSEVLAVEFNQFTFDHGKI